jgi:dipeptidase D
MHGVKHIATDFISAKYLLNLDSEDIGIITIGSAGGFCGDFKFPTYPTIPCPKDSTKLSIKVANCSGGHSGCEIHEYKANAIKLLTRLLQLAMQYDGQLAGIKGGSAHNAIPMDAEAWVCFLDAKKAESFKEKALELGQFIKKEFKTTDSMIDVIIEKAQCECKCDTECCCISTTNS